MIKNIVIVGGGTAGWITASVLAKGLGCKHFNILLIESDSIGTIGVGEATTPPIRALNSFLGLEEADFVKSTSATYKLGIEFENWGSVGTSYFHPFGPLSMDTVKYDPYDFIMPFWLRFVKAGGNMDIAGFSLEACAARENKFSMEKRYQRLSYAYHFDASKYAQYLREYSIKMGVIRREGKVVDVRNSPQNNDIELLFLEDGTEIKGDIFVDCSGQHGLLISQNMGVEFEDWSKWLPNNTAIAVQTELREEPAPYTRSTAHGSGWQWKIPLQSRVGNGYVFSDKFQSQEKAKDLLLNSIEGELVSEPRVIKFKTGVRKQMWKGNCVAIGLSGGFLEPLESTSIHLIQVAAFRLLNCFPGGEISMDLLVDFNASMKKEYEEIKDFIIAHYKVTNREDSEYWKYLKNMDVPDSLQHKLSLFEQRGEVLGKPGDFFHEVSWFMVLMGQGLIPKGFSPKAYSLEETELVNKFSVLRSRVKNFVNDMPTHSRYIKELIAVN